MPLIMIAIKRSSKMNQAIAKVEREEPVRIRAIKEPFKRISLAVNCEDLPSFIR